MKKLLLTATVLMVLASCEETNVERKQTPYTIDINHELEIVEVEGCQYLYGPWGGSTVLTHKGNCKNPIHKQQ
jgi:hypothetical protein